MRSPFPSYSVSSATATAAATTAVITAGVVVTAIDQQKDDNDEQKPAAVDAVKQISQTHTVRRLLSLFSVHTMRGLRLW